VQDCVKEICDEEYLELSDEEEVDVFEEIVYLFFLQHSDKFETVWVDLSENLEKHNP